LSSLFSLFLLVMITLLVSSSWFLTFNAIVFLFDIFVHDCLVGFLVMVFHSLLSFVFAPFGCDNLLGLLVMVFGVHHCCLL
jgi:hypothetical protein